MSSYFLRERCMMHAPLIMSITLFPSLFSASTSWALGFVVSFFCFIHG